MAKGKEFKTNITIGGAVAKSLSKALGITEKEVSSTMQKVANVGKTVAKVGLAMGAAAATGAVAIGKAAMESYAEYEQLAGGAQLMFGDAYSFVAEKAQTAYKDVQMSQNEYLQQVNGFATGLKTSLGGNAQAAAELAHKIVKAEADVVAATGNTAENVQNAFNGIMKSNFTMLDNLQLGITPTKEGFQDLINKVNQWNASNGKFTKYTINNLADCQSALVDYIEMQGVAGYASNEAAGTIQGSLAMTKAAWSNLVTGVADENANTDVLIDAFVESISALGENLLPKVSEILKKIPSLIEGLLPLIPPAIETLLPAVVDGATLIIQGVGDVMPQLVDAVVNAMGQIISGTFDAMPTPILLIASTIGALTVALKAYNAVVTIKKILDKAQEVGMWNIVKAQIAQNAAFLASPIFWIIAGIVALVAAFVILWNKCEGFRAFWIAAWELIKTVALAVWEGIKAGAMAAWEGIKTVWEGIKTGAINAWESIENAFGKIGDWFKEKFEAVKTAIQPTLDWITGKIDAVKNGWDNVKNFFTGGGDGGGIFARRFATGGTVTRPQLAIVGDAPETIVPHGNTPRNRALLAEAAANVTGGTNYGGVNITFAPVIQGGSGADVKQAINESEILFEQQMDNYFKKKGRVSFA